MKFGMQLPYGNASGQFFYFFEFRNGFQKNLVFFLQKQVTLTLPWTEYYTGMVLVAELSVHVPMFIQIGSNIPQRGS